MEEPPLERQACKTILKAAARYRRRLEAGERVMRDAAGRMQWMDGRRVGLATIAHMLVTGGIHQLDADLFGFPDHGQTLGLEQPDTCDGRRNGCP